MDTPAERIELELSGTRAYDRRDLEIEATSEDPFWVDLCALHCGSLGEGEILDTLYKPRRLLLRSALPDGPKLEVLLPPEGCSRENLRAWRMECGNGEGSVHVEIRRYGKAAYYGGKTYNITPELLPPEPAPSPPVATHALVTPGGAPSPERPSAMERVLDKLMAPGGPEWAHQMVAVVGGGALELVLGYKERVAEAEEEARLRARLRHLQENREELQQQVSELTRLRRAIEAETRALEQSEARLQEAQHASHAPVLPISPPAAAPSYAPPILAACRPPGHPGPCGRACLRPMNLTGQPLGAGLPLTPRSDHGDPAAPHRQGPR